MKTLLTKKQFENYKKRDEELLEIICQYENESDVPTDVMKEFRKINQALIDYEKAYHPLPWEVSTLITDEIKKQMEKKHLKQRSLSKLLGIDESRVSEIMNGKRSLNLNIVKKLHTELNIPSDFLLAHS
jgi:antitoxin component HigA of HigAB toxin-antitoxin module